jgi:hypothetical protein
MLFLRAFRDDQVPLGAPEIALFGRLLEIGRRANTTGPVVGLGSPTDKRSPYGAARGYFTGESWQKAVANLAASADFIVICIDDTAGVSWEVERLASCYLDKSLFLIHPRYAGMAENAQIITKIAQYFRDGEDATLLWSGEQMKSGSERPRVIRLLSRSWGQAELHAKLNLLALCLSVALRVFMRTTAH